MLDYQAILSHAHSRMTDLRKQAQHMVDEHWDYYTRENKKQDFKQKSMLFPRIGKSKHAFRIEWHHIKKWYKNFKGEWKKQTRYVAIGRGNKYNLDKYTVAWERPVIEEFESQAESIRREVKALDEIIRSCESLLSRGLVTELDSAVLNAPESAPKRRRHSAADVPSDES